ncbi:atp synthase subunit mitochondrial [Alternaria alternata]|nr:atp synthase subunit mitochondrial [Alternaria alternata]
MVMEWRMGSSAVRKKVLRFGRKARTLASTTNPKKAASQPSSITTTPRRPLWRVIRRARTG